MPPQLRRNTSIEVYGRIDTRHVPGLDKNIFYVFVTKSECTNPTYLITGTTYDNHL